MCERITVEDLLNIVREDVRKEESQRRVERAKAALKRGKAGKKPAPKRKTP